MINTFYASNTDIIKGRLGNEASVAAKNIIRPTGCPNKHTAWTLSVYLETAVALDKHNSYVLKCCLCFFLLADFSYISILSLLMKCYLEIVGMVNSKRLAVEQFI